MNDNTYHASITVRLVEPGGGEVAEQTVERELPRVSAISRVLDKSDALVGWAYNLGVLGTLELAATGIGITGWEPGQVKAALKAAGMTPYATRDAAARRGQAAHEVLKALADGADPEEVEASLEDLDDEVRGYARAVLAWWADERPLPVLAEAVVVSLEHGFAGKLDLLAQRQGHGLVLTDAKTSPRLYDEMRVQLGGYALALEEFGRQFDAASILLLRENGTYKEVFVEPQREAFLHARRLYERLQALREEEE